MSSSLNIDIHGENKVSIIISRLWTLIPLYPRRSPSPPATRTNAAFRTSFTPASSKLIKLSSPKVKVSPFGTWKEIDKYQVSFYRELEKEMLHCCPTLAYMICYPSNEIMWMDPEISTWSNTHTHMYRYIRYIYIYNHSNMYRQLTLNKMCRC